MSFTLRIFESEYEEMKNFVLKYPHIETGGDLFGLWKANGDPVVQLIIGPGQECRRTTVSFHQDTNYLARVGTFVNTSYMLCHIGSWHSHHQLNLTQPSTGDRSTVCNNFPVGLQQYIMIIANIKGNSVKIHPYMFSQGGHVCNQGEVEKIRMRSPFRGVGHVLSHITQGAEHSLPRDAYSSMADYHSRPSTHSKLATISSNRNSYSPMKSNSDYQRISDQRSSHLRTHNISTNDEPMDVDPQDQQPHTESKYLNRSPNARNNQLNTNHHRTSWTTGINCEDTDKKPQWYETEEGGSILKKINHEIESTMARDINYYRDSTSKDLTMEFSHDAQKWVITFPKLFDKLPAVIKYSGKQVPSKNIVKDVRDACKCGHCQRHIVQHTSSLTKHDHQPSLSRDNHQAYSTSKQESKPSSSTQDRQPSPTRQDLQPSPSRDGRQPSPSRQGRQRSPSKHDRQSSPSRPDRQPYSPKQHRQSSSSVGGQSSPSRHRYRPYTSKQDRHSPSQKRQSPPWYDTPQGIATFNLVKTDIETNFQAEDKVRVRKTHASKVLIFNHGKHDWSIEFINSPSKDINIMKKKEGDGGRTPVVKLTSPSDIVGALQRSCFCPRCRSTTRTPSGQRRGRALTRPSSRHFSTKVSPTPNRVSLPPTHDKCFATENGEKKFERIHSDIKAMFPDATGVDMRRGVNSREVTLTFNHKRKQWKLTFPFNYPQESPKLEFTYMYGTGCCYPVNVVDNDIIRAVRKHCCCFSCMQYGYGAR